MTNPSLRPRPNLLIRKKKNKTEAYALGRHISLSVDKARRVIDQIRGRSYQETLMILELMPYRACYPIFKLVYSAAANASYSLGSTEANLVISKAEVNEGTTTKKLKPRARGRSNAIKRTTCHITIAVKDISLDEYIYEEMYPLNIKKSIWNWRNWNWDWDWIWNRKKPDMVDKDMSSSGVVWDKK